MTGEVVEDDDVAGFEFGDEELPHILGKDLAVHRLVDDQRGEDAIPAQSGEEGGDLPMAGRRITFYALAARGPPIAAYHVGSDAGLIEEDQPLAGKGGLRLAPSLTCRDNVSAQLFRGVNALF
jgi:hypothetical protein